MKPISLQLYTLRALSEKDFAGVIRTVGSIGYSGVEPAGFYGMKPRDLRRLVEEEGMVISSSHTPPVSPQTIPEVIQTAGEMGVDLVCGGYGPEDFKDRDAIRRTADLVNGMVDKLRSAGLTLVLHNHFWEFEVLDGRLKHELFAELAPRVSFEIDTYWAANFGANDPAAMVRIFAARAPLLHIKDGPMVRGQPMTAVGKGKLDTRGVVAAADPKVLRWLVIELDECATDMLQAVRDSYTYMIREGLAKGRK